ncbi:divalent-cation tolerance protein CutA [Desulfobulbus oralis]|uniref:Cytochrome C biogenesis protein CcdA n=1 Tax=Desulfobulbus oralis TaxID=1986146 RepID=A0A2L1GRH8_9BACT|nr:divalent-cation tolerance protein CutA [Desulfobulbus oralis]AVD72224.1 cytochrome C biogenesis protein CcdA [Desulfobulbus oralis]
MKDYIQVTTTIDTNARAERLAQALLEKRLAASVQVVPCWSAYRWQGRIERGREFRCAIKTRADLWPELVALIRSLHPYEVPEIFATAILDVTQAYGAWLDEELAEAHDGR